MYHLTWFSGSLVCLLLPTVMTQGLFERLSTELALWQTGKPLWGAILGKTEVGAIGSRKHSERPDSRWKKVQWQRLKLGGGNFWIIAYARGCFTFVFPRRGTAHNLKKQSLFRFLTPLDSVGRSHTIGFLLSLDSPTWNCEDATGSTGRSLAEDGTGECDEWGELSSELCYFVASGSPTLIWRASAQIDSPHCVK